MSKISPKSRRAVEVLMEDSHGDLAGCPVHELRMRLAAAGLRPTRQRMSLGWLLFSKGDRHLTAENLQDEAQESHVSISLATIYNSLHQFTSAGLLREVAVDGTRTFFDTNTSKHHHFLDDGVLIDIPELPIDVTKLPETPAGKRITDIEVIVRLSESQAI
jgi:Fur family iron response transcriptional regulator